MDLWLIFFTGLTVGGLTCLAVQGGLLASTLAAREEEEIREGKFHKQRVWPTLAFLVTKLFAYIILGALLGAFGSLLQLTEGMRITMQLISGVYMIVIALNLLNVHPIFRYAIIQPPKFAFRLLRNQSRSKDIFAPALLGVLTVFIPCGTTLAMEALAISTGNALSGAAIMGVFILGTSPLFFGLGFLTTILGDAFRTKFLKVAAALVFYIGVTSVNGSLILAGSPITLQSLSALSPVEINFNPNESFAISNSSLSGEVQNGVRVIDLTVNSGGYNPNYIRIKKGEPVKLNLISNNAYSCALAFRIPSLKIAKNLRPTGVETIEFTPAKSGPILFSCSMGMYTGTIEVI